MTEPSELTQILREEAEAHRELLRLKSRERDEVIHGRMEDLEETISAIGRTVDRVRDLEDRRASVGSAVSVELGLDNLLPTLRELASVLPEAESREILRTGDELRDLAGQVQRINGQTRYLVSQSLEWMSSLMAELTGRPIGRTGYDARGENAGTTGPLILSRTA